MVKINGEYKDVVGTSISDYLAESGYDSKRVAVERNGEILPKAQYDSTILHDEDCIEIVSFVGGG